MVSDQEVKLEKNRAPILIMSILIHGDSKLILPVPDERGRLSALPFIICIGERLPK
jgi:hypothetical protein